MNTTISKLSAVKAFLQLPFFVIIFLCFSKNAYSQQACNGGAGDQTTYGAGSWIGYVYDHTGSGNPVTNPFATYKGFVTEAEQFDRNWGNNNTNGRPSCAFNGNNFAVRYRMTKNFPCGYYIFTVGGDDGVRLSVDGGATWLINGWIDQGYAIRTSLPIQLNGSTNLVLEYYEKGSDARVSFNYTTGTGVTVSTYAGEDIKCNSAQLQGTVSTQYSVQLLDTYGDGWSGGKLTISVGGVNVYSDITLPNGYNSGYYNFSVQNGQNIVVTYVAGTFSGENYYRVHSGANGGGILIVQSTNAPPGTASITNLLSSATYNWSPATGLSATNILNPIANPPVSTTYTLATTYGCLTVTDQVKVDPLIMTGSFNICAGSISDLAVAGETDWTTMPTGGTVTTSGNDRIHTFNTSGTFTSAYPISDAQVLVVGGGGGGGQNGGGGGGAGAYSYTTNISLTSGTTATIGAGGTSGGSPAANGSASSFGAISAIGGGGGASRDAGAGGQIGASGGGGGGSEVAARRLGGAASAGNIAGIGIGGGCNAAGGGGGGAGGNGGNASSNIGGAGGLGVQNNISGSNQWYAGGGGGGLTGYVGCGGNNSWTGTNGSGGSGVGGNGESTAGAANTGSGGGAERNGGSGVVIVRYQAPKWTVATGTGSATIDAQTGVLTGVNPGTVTVTYTNANGCSVNQIVTIKSVATAPTAISGGGNYCHGNTATLTATGGNSGTNEVIVWQEGACNTAYEQNWGEQPFGVASTNVNSVNGILNVTSTTNDPLIDMGGLGSFNPNTYKYINIRYKVTAGTASSAQIFWYNGLFSSANGLQYTNSPALISDNSWHILSIDMTTPTAGDWFHSNVTGWRYDWATANGVTMEIDFISLDEFPIIAEGASYTTPPFSQTKTFYASRRSECGATSCISSTVTLPTAGTTLSGNGESATCIVNGTNIINFYHSSGRLIASINPNGQNLGSVTATSYVDAGLSVPACADPTNPNYNTATMGRHWVITPTNQPASAVLVGLPFSPSEYTAVAAASMANTNPNDNLASLASLKLSKYSGTNEDALFSNNCGNGVTTLWNQSANGLVNSYNPTFNGTDQYASFSITSFSEFWLHGSTSSPLPVKLTNFSATCDNEVTLSWTTESEQNSDRFIVEKSRDGQTWSNVGEQAAAGNSNTTLNYNFTDLNSWNATSYYRLRQIDFNGAEEIYGPISVSCENKGSSLTVYPNPNSGSFTIEVASTEMYNDAQLILTDLTGKTIASQKVNVANGTTQILINDLDLKMGTYLVTLRGADQQLKPVKVMVTK